MTTELAKTFDGKKFMWDGRVYETRVAADKVMEEYQNDNFEVRLAEAEEGILLYTRRVIKEVAVTVP